MIIGMGIDVEDVERVRGAMERQGERFLRRIFTEKERAYCEQFKDKYERYAGRFAVKEAAMKALGTGGRRGVRWAADAGIERRGAQDCGAAGRQEYCNQYYAYSDASNGAGNF